MKKIFKKAVKFSLKIIGIPAGMRRMIRLVISSSKFLDAGFRYQLRGVSESCWKDEVLEAKTIAGLKFFYPNKSIIGLRAAEFGIYNEFSFLLDLFVPEPKMIIEVGANIGADTLSMASQLPANVKIITFEPCDKYRAVLEKNIAANNLKNVSVYNYFVSAEADTEVKLFVTASSAGGANAYPASFPVVGTQPCSTITLDKFVERNNLEVLDFLKVDTDGWDEQVIQGAAETIKRFQPFLFVEFDEDLLKKAGNSSASFAALLHQLGYNEFYVFGRIGKPPLHLKGDEKLIASFTPGNTFNVFALPVTKVIK